MHTDVEMQEMQRRLAAFNLGFRMSEVVTQGHQNPYAGAPIRVSIAVPGMFNFGKNRSRNQTQAVNISRPQVTNLKTGKIHHEIFQKMR